MDAVVGIEGAEPWSAGGSGERADIGVVVVHGLTGNPLATRPIGQWFAAEGYAVEVPLLPGHGTTARDLGQTRYVDWYGTVERVVDHLATGCSRIVLVGHSMGGTIAVDYASRHPERIQAVAAINAQISERVGLLPKLAPVLQYAMPYVPRQLAGLPADDIARPGIEEGAYGMLPARAAQSFVSQLRRIRGQLVDLNQPLLVAVAPDDHTVPADNSDVLQELVGSIDVTTLVCDRSYHLPQLDYDAEKLRTALLRFVADHVG